MPSYLDYIHGNTIFSNILWNVVDFETTMGHKGKEPIEIAIVPIINRVIKKEDIFNSFIKPNNPTPFWLEEKHKVKVTTKMLNDAPNLDEIAGEVRKKMLPGVFVAHMGKNKFDINIASDHFSINTKRIIHFDTMTLSRNLFPNNKTKKKHNLDVVCKRFKVTNRDPHRAISDAMATARIFLKILNMLEENGVYNFAGFQKFHEVGFGY
jgi:DNA polymerase III epsilon subunit-like protein